MTRYQFVGNVACEMEVWILVNCTRDEMQMALPPPKTLGNELPKDGAACMAGKAILPMLEVPSNPNTPLTWFTVMAFQMRTIFGSNSRDCGCRHLVHSNVQSVDSIL
jgi:hypothetical protein